MKKTKTTFRIVPSQQKNDNPHALGEALSKMIYIFWQSDQERIAKGEEPVSERPENFKPFSPFKDQ